MSRDNLVLLILCGIFLFSCNGRQSEIADQLRSLYGKKIEFVHGNHFVVDGRDTLLCEERNPDFKIVIFADSTGCQPCNLRLGELGLKMRELTFIDKNVQFVIIVQNTDYGKFEHMVEHDMPGFPFVYDPQGVFLQVNDLPSDHRFHAFL